MTERLTRRACGGLLAGAALAGGLVPSGGRTGRAQDEPRRGGTLVATWGGGEPPAPYVPSGGGPGALFASSKVLERLARRRLDGGFEGELAEAWTPAGDFRSYTVKIRKEVAFHDGAAMTPADVVYSVEAIWRTLAAAPSLAGFAGIEAAADDRVVLRFDRPVPQFFFAALLSAPANYVVPRHVYQGRDPASHPANAAPIGTGPWRFEEAVRGSHFAYRRNERYWRPERRWPDRLVLRFVRDPAGRAAAMEAGEIQLGVLNPLLPHDTRRLAATGRFVATASGATQTAGSTTLACNLRRPILARREVRQAIFHALDRSLIARTIYAGYARPGSGPIVSSNLEYFSPDTYSTAFDPKQAAALLDAAGHPQKGKARRFTLELVAAGWFADNGRVGAYVKQALEEIGIGVDLAVPDRATSLRRLYGDYDFDLAISNQASPPEPVPWTTRCFTTAGIRPGLPFANASGFHSEAVDALVERIEVETDPAQRRTLVAEFQKIISFEAPMLPLVELDSLTVAGTAVRNPSDDADFPAASWHDLWLAR